METVCSRMELVNANCRSIRVPSSCLGPGSTALRCRGHNSVSIPQLTERHQKLAVRLLARPRAEEGGNTGLSCLQLSVCSERFAQRFRDGREGHATIRCLQNLFRIQPQERPGRTVN